MLVFAAIAEIATGLALLVVPSLVGQLPLGQPLDGIVGDIARLTGITLIALGLACWPGPPKFGMLVYSALVMIELARFVWREALSAPCCGRPSYCILVWRS